MIDFTEITYLQSGNTRQRAAYQVLQTLGVLTDLQAYTPRLTGTIPIGIDLPSSDLDIICCCSDHSTFSALVKKLYGKYSRFTIQTYDREAVTCTVASFAYQSFELEIFAQHIPVDEQLAYRHMLIEYEVLQKEGAAFKNQIIQLKQQGWKTEPAFAQLLGLEGDPYQALLAFKVET